jgi:hypothetical protein
MALIAQGYYEGPADGEFGETTEAAVSRFQSDYGIEANGIADEKTLEQLYELESKRAETERNDGLETPNTSVTEMEITLKQEEIPVQEEKRIRKPAPKKPIIYLYPETETELNVKLGKPENITVSYPAYGDGWHVLAQPDGALVDLETGRRLYALYWEGKNAEVPAMDEGFVVAGADTAPFLEEKLALLGLSEREAEEFIVYWLPALQESPYNLICFETMEEIEDYMPLKLSVEPDTLIRVLMAYRPLEEAVEVPEQVLPQTPERKGFTVVEWGGTKAE